MAKSPQQTQSESRPVVVKISRKVIPASMSYDAYVAVYKELLEYVRILQITKQPGLSRDGEIAFLTDQAKLQKYLKVSNGKLPGTKRRINAALDRIRRMNGSFEHISPSSRPSELHTLSPHTAYSDSDEHMEPASMDTEAEMSAEPQSPLDTTRPAVTSQRQAASPVSVAVTMECIASPSVPLSAGFELDGNRSMSIKLEVRESPSSTRACSPVEQHTPPSDEQEEEKGIATLIAMRRIKNKSQDTPFPAPLSTRAINTSYHSHSLGTPDRLSSLPSSHPYYRSHRVLASPISARAPMIAHTPIPNGARLPMSASLPRALSDLPLRHAVQPGPNDREQAPTPVSAYSATMASPRGSPRIFIPPHPLLAPATGRPIKHFRSTSDAGPSSAGGSRLRFIPPPARPSGGPSTPTRRYILPPQAAASPVLRQRFLPRSPPHYHPYAERDELPSPSPHKESFLRSEPPASGSPPAKKTLVYQPCGSVETRRVSPKQSQEQVAPTGRRVTIPPPRAGAAPPIFMGHPDQPMAHNPLKRSYTDSDGAQGSQMRYIDPPTAPGSKRPRSNCSNSDAESTGSTSSSKSAGQRMRFIAPPSRPHMPQSSSQGWAPGRTSPPNGRRHLAPSYATLPEPIPDRVMANAGGTSILSALIEEVSGAQGAVERSGNDEAAKALEDVAARLAQLAQKMRRGR